MDLIPPGEEELEFVDAMLLEYGNDDSVLGISELDGFLTAIISGPEVILPSRWYPELWGGPDREPEWGSENEFRRFFDVLTRHMNANVRVLMEAPEQFEAMFLISTRSDTEVLIVEEWCFGYMRGVALGGWPELSGEARAHLEAIKLHGCEENFDKLDRYTLQEHQQAARQVEPAARALHAYWLAQRTPPGTFRAEPRVGRNDPCPCGSGKKYKKCCLH